MEPTTDTPRLVIPGINDRSTLACIARSRKYEQYVRAVLNARLHVCPFCDVDRSYNNIILENDFWYAWHSKPPEANTRLHILYVPKRHVVDSEELSNDEVLALWGENGIRRLVREALGYSSRGMLMRDGDATLSAGTIQHLHIHDMIPNGTGRVESPFFKGAESELEGVRRAIVFEKLRGGSELEDLSPEERELVNGRL